MNWPRLVAVLLSIGVHGGVVYAIYPRSDSFALESGRGADDLTVVATVSLENGELFGTADQNQEAQEATPQSNASSEPKQQEEPKPETVAKAEPPKPEETEPAPVAETKPEEKPVVKEAETSPPPKPQPEAQAQAPTPQVDEQVTAKALEGRRTKLASLYQVKIFTALVRNKVHPHTNIKGRVVLVLTIAPSGQLMSRVVVQSSGSDILDRAAIASLEKAAPFPPIPQDLSAGPYTLRVPFEYSTR